MPYWLNLATLTVGKEACEEDDHTGLNHAREDVVPSGPQDNAATEREETSDSGGTASSSASSSGSGRAVYRGMKEGTNGLPETGPSARELGVRPNLDIPVIGGQVKPNTGGMSVAPDTPGNLPAHRRPPSLGGTGKDPVWELDLRYLGPSVRFRQDKVSHGLLEPAHDMSLASFQQALADLAKHWKKL